jgi:hypothetical protein
MDRAQTLLVEAVHCCLAPCRCGKGWMTDQWQNTSADRNGNAVVVSQETLNIPLQSSIMTQHAGKQRLALHMSRQSLLLYIRVRKNNHAVTACFESTNRRHHIQATDIIFSKF